MPSIPPVLIIGVNPIVKIVVPLLRTFGFQIAHLWSPRRLTAEIVSLCQETLKIESYSCSTSSLDQLLTNANESYLVFICTETDQHASLIKRLTSLAIIKPCAHHLVCMPPFNVDPKSLVSVQQIQEQLCCYCYPLGFLPTFIKLKRYLTEEQTQLGNDEADRSFRSLSSCSSVSRWDSSDWVSHSLLHVEIVLQRSHR